MQHGGDNTYFLLVSSGEIAYELLLSYDFTIHEAFKKNETIIYFFFFQSIHLADEIEIFLRGEVVYKKTVVNESAGKSLPVFTLGYIYIIDGDIPMICLQ